MKKRPKASKQKNPKEVRVVIPAPTPELPRQTDANNPLGFTNPLSPISPFNPIGIFSGKW